VKKIVLMKQISNSIEKHEFHGKNTNSEAQLESQQAVENCGPC